MKVQTRYSSLIIRMALTFAIITACPSAFADAISVFTSFYVPIFGAQAAQVPPTSLANCKLMEGNNSGIFTRMNSLLCHLRNDLGVSGVGNFTQSLSGNTVTFHGEISSGCTAGNVSGTTTAYNFKINLWACTGSSTTCNATSLFSRIISVCFNYIDDGSGINGTVNAGELITDNSIFDGAASGSEIDYIAWDLGASSPAQKGIAKGAHNNVGGNTFQYRVDMNRPDKTHLNFSAAINSTAGSFPTTRFSGTVLKSANTGTAYQEASGATGTGTSGTVNTTAAGDTPSTGECFTRATSSNDFTYTAATGSNCVPGPLPADNLTTIGAYTVNSLAGTWHGMSANPGSL